MPPIMSRGVDAIVNRPTLSDDEDLRITLREQRYNHEIISIITRIYNISAIKRRRQDT